MSKYIVEIRDEDMEEGCAGCPMNYDYVQCTASYGTDDPLFDWQWDGRKNERPENCPLVPYEELRELCGAMLRYILPSDKRYTLKESMAIVDDFADKCEEFGIEVGE